MSVRVWNTLTRRNEDLRPLAPARLRLSVCGATVDRESAAGAARRDDALRP